MTVTRDSARLLDADSIGSCGWVRGDFVVLRADPRADIANLGTIVEVVRRLIERPAALKPRS